MCKQNVKLTIRRGHDANKLICQEILNGLTHFEAESTYRCLAKHLLAGKLWFKEKLENINVNPKNENDF